MKRFIAMVAAILPGSLAAHPHMEVEQQLHVTVGAQTAQVSWLIAAPDSGGHIFEHVDKNADGLLDDEELAAFSEKLLSATVFEADGRPVDLVITGLTFPDKEKLLSGASLIEMTARARGPVTTAGRIIVSIGFDTFSDDWFVQPYYLESLVQNSTPRIERDRNILAINLK